MPENTGDLNVFDYLETWHAVRQVLLGESDVPVEEVTQAWFKSIRDRSIAVREAAG